MTDPTIPQSETAPCITICMTSYNAEDTISYALDSALAQDWPNYELIIVDDGSQDTSPAIIRNKIRNCSNVRLIPHKENKGFPAALNTAIANANGAFIAILDDDDESRPNRLRAQYETITTYEREAGVDLVACYGSGYRYYNNGYTVPLYAIGSHPNPPKGEMIEDYIFFLGKHKGVFYGNGLPSCSLMARKSTFDAVGSYDENLHRHEDCDFAIRLGKLGGHFIGCRAPVLNQYSTGGTDKRPEVMYNSNYALIEKYRGDLIRKGRYNYAHDWIRLRYYHFASQPFHALLALLRLGARHPRWTGSHFLYSAPRRLIHGLRMRLKSPVKSGTR